MSKVNRCYCLQSLGWLWTRAYTFGFSVMKARASAFEPKKPLCCLLVILLLFFRRLLAIFGVSWTPLRTPTMKTRQCWWLGWMNWSAPYFELARKGWMTSSAGKRDRLLKSQLPVWSRIMGKESSQTRMVKSLKNMQLQRGTQRDLQSVCCGREVNHLWGRTGSLSISGNSLEHLWIRPVQILKADSNGIKTRLHHIAG